MINTIKYEKFVNQLKQFIEKEKLQNQSTLGKILEVNNEIIDVSLKKPIKLPLNTHLEVNKIQCTLHKNNQKNIQLKTKHPQHFQKNQTIKINNIQQDIILSKIQQTLTNIEENKINQENKETLKTIINQQKTTYTQKKYTNKKLNPKQEQAVKKAITTEKFHIIKGPPGTGKTHTITQIIRQLYQEQQTILLTTHTHIALDNILEKLDDIPQQDIIRLGINEKIAPTTQKYTLQKQLQRHPKYKQIQQLQQQSKTTITHNNKQTLLSKLINKIINTEEIKIQQLQEKEKIEEQEKTREQIEKIESQIQEELLDNAKIIATTVISSSNYLTRNIEFDYTIMDESSQIPVYLAIIPLMKTDKFLLIGDDQQLQPISNKNASYFLNKSIFNLMIEKYPKNHTFLDTQYRMNEKISQIASKLYYNNKLKTHESAKKKQIQLTNNNYYLLDNSTITFIDTTNTTYNEDVISGGCQNTHETLLILKIVEALIDNQIREDDIGIITPYRKQKLNIQSHLRKHKYNIETDTIYRFQGREKDVIIISFCKSSYKSLTTFQKKFLGNTNQLNVSITRSRKKLIIIGDYSLLSTDENLKAFLDSISPLDMIYLEDIIR